MMVLTGSIAIDELMGFFPEIPRLNNPEVGKPWSMDEVINRTCIWNHSGGSGGV